MANTDVLIAGIEGGGTHSTCVVLSGDGSTLASLTGPSMNHYQIGLPEMVERIHTLLQEALRQAGLPAGSTFKALGLCLSGCEAPSTAVEVRGAMLARRPPIAEGVFVGSDTLSPIAAACENGGIVLISGTGSNSLLLNPDGKTHRCGGWGHMLGEEGSGYWTAARAIKLLFDEEDRLATPAHDTAALRGLVYAHFGVSDRFGLLGPAYTTFDKSQFAALTAGIAGLARGGDALCAGLMADAGRALGRHVAALGHSVCPSLLASPAGLPVVCAGSLWKSWELLKGGFLEGVGAGVPRYQLLVLKTSGAVGAAYLAAREAGCVVPRDLAANTSLLYRHGG